MLENIGGTREEDRIALARKVGAERAVAVEVILHGLAIISAKFPRARSLLIQHRRGRSIQRVTTTHGVSPALMNSALSATRHGCAQALAA